MSGSHRPSHGFVHLKGAIQHPGIYPVKENTRWDEVVKAAGGLTAAADIQQVNLAKIASDQESLYVPAKGETSTATALLLLGSPPRLPVVPLLILIKRMWRN